VDVAAIFLVTKC